MLFRSGKEHSSHAVRRRRASAKGNASQAKGRQQRHRRRRGAEQDAVVCLPLSMKGGARGARVASTSHLSLCLRKKRGRGKSGATRRGCVRRRRRLAGCACRRSRNGGPQTCLPAAHSVAPPAALHGPSSPANTQDPREGPSLARRTTQDFLRSGLTRLAREGRRDQGKGHLARFL